MAEHSSGDSTLGDLEVLMKAKDKEIQILQNEILRLRLLLEERKEFCSACCNELSTPIIAKSCCERCGLSTEAGTSTKSRADQISLCCCSSYLELALSCDAETQTFETDFLGVDSCGSAEDWQPPEGSDCTVADLVKQVVEEVSPQSDYIYDENYKMYYSPSTGYYYDMERNLLYDSHSGTYYSYDSQSNTYEFYYRVMHENELHTDSSEVVGAAVNNLKITNCSQESSIECAEIVQNIKVKLKGKKKAVKTSSVNEENMSDGSKLKNQSTSISWTVEEEKDDESLLEEGELGSPYAESTTTEGSYYLSPVSSPASANFDDDSSESWPPCIRLIVEESTKLQIGSLLLITCTGANVGRDKNSRLCIPDVSVSKIHAEISYDNETCKYYVTDLGSQNGTFINGTRLSQPKEKSVLHILKHSDHLCFGFCKLLVHIHPGTETCDECEPGQVQAKYNEQSGKLVPLIQTKEEKEKERRRRLRQLKMKFGLQNMNYEQDISSTHPPNPNYQDRTKERQKTKGSDNPYEKTAEPASLHVTISSDNKGYQLLKKMGWKEGEALGAKTSGETEPVPINVRRSRAGLGSGTAADNAVPLDPRNRKWRKAQRRYYQTTPESSSIGSSSSPKFVGAVEDTL